MHRRYSEKNSEGIQKEFTEIVQKEFTERIQKTLEFIQSAFPEDYSKRNHSRY